jgi:Domain of unknown function (DUF1707)
VFGLRTARPEDQLRATDAEREHVVELLQRAVGLGMLGLDEFGARADQALAAVTREHLSAVLLDLPVDDAPVSGRPEDVLVLRTRLSEVSRRGRWRVPKRVLISSRLGSTRLDFTSATLDHPTLAIELDVTAGSVDLLVPRGASVDTSAVALDTGELTDRGAGRDAVPGGPTLVLSGRVRAGQLRIHRPSYLKRLALRLPRFR